MVDWGQKGRHSVSHFRETMFPACLLIDAKHPKLDTITTNNNTHKTYARKLLTYAQIKPNKTRQVQKPFRTSDQEMDQTCSIAPGIRTRPYGKKAK